MAARHAAAMDHAAGARVTRGLRRSVARRRALLQDVALCCNASFSVATRRALLQDVAICCNTSRSVATRRSLLQDVAPCLQRQIAPIVGREVTTEHLLPLFLRLLKDDFPEVRADGPVPAQMWDGQSWRRCGTASPGADVGRPIPAQMWDGQSWRRCGMASLGADVEPSLGADVAGGEPSLGADVAGVSPVPQPTFVDIMGRAEAHIE
jgi:hypothetical protein